MSELIRAALLPAAMWGMLSALLLELIELRGLFIAGGAARLRLSTLAFALGVVLIQRLEAEQGKSAAGKYGLALGASMLLFTIVETLTWSLPVSTFFVNVVLLGVLWWAGHNLTAACAMEDAAASAAAERGIFSRQTGAASASPAKDETKRETPSTKDMSEADARLALFDYAMQEADPLAAQSADVQDIYRDFQQAQQSKKAERREERRQKRTQERVAGGEESWVSRIGGRHPGRVLLYFALFAVPVFGASAVLGNGANHPARSGIFLFVYLWCALTLLWLASLGQIRAYFRRREAILPEVVAMSWIGMGLLATTLAVFAAFLLPAPVSASNQLVRQRLIAQYRGWQAEWGLRDESPQGAPSNRKTRNASPAGGGRSGNATEGGGVEKGSGGAGESGRGETAQPAQSPSVQPDPIFDSALEKFFQGFLFVLGAVLLVIGLIVLYVLAVYIVRNLGAGLQRKQIGGKKKKPQTSRCTEQTEMAATRSFASFGDPFAFAGNSTDLQVAVKELWAATVAYATERGAQATPGTTPREFLADNAQPLTKILNEAKWLADLFDFSEFSGRPIPNAARPRLEAYWKALRASA